MSEISFLRQIRYLLSFTNQGEIRVVTIHYNEQLFIFSPSNTVSRSQHPFLVDQGATTKMLAEILETGLPRPTSWHSICPPNNF